MRRLLAAAGLLTAVGVAVALLALLGLAAASVGGPALVEMTGARP